MRKFVLLFLSALTAGTIFAQSRQVSGTVITDNGEPLPGVTVILKGTQTADVTNANGRFSIMAPENSTLQFSLPGYGSREVSVGAGTTELTVTLEMVNIIEDVVVIGYGTGQRKGTVSGSLSIVEGSVVENRPSPNIADALQGQVSGLSLIQTSSEPSAGSEIMLHGAGSISSGTSPLVVVDGVPTNERILTRLNPSDIESVTVLKDASSTSIYGSRAANGVMFITTKGSRVEQAPTVRLNAHYGVSSPARSKYNMMGAQELLDFQKEFGEITPEAYTKFSNRVAERGSFDWFNYIFKPKPTYNVDLSVSGGSRNSSYYISGMYMSKEGIAPRSKTERYGVRANVDSRITNWLKAGTKIYISYDKNQTAFSAQNVMTTPGFLSRMVPAYFFPTKDEGGLNFFMEGKIYEPYNFAEKHPGQTDYVNLNGSAYVIITPLKGLNIRSTGGIDAWEYTTRSHTLASWQGGNGSGSTARSFLQSRNFSITNEIEYKFSVADDHHFTALVGQEGLIYDNNSFGVTTTGQTDDRLMLLSSGTEVVIGNVSEGYASNAMLSFFGRINYDYKEKYGADVSLRNDASSKFGKTNRNAFFWSVGGFWNIDRENFMQNQNIVKSLRLRANYGTQGNSDIGNYEHLGLVGTTQYEGSVGWYLASPGNPALGWEKQAMFTVGVDVNLWNRLNISASYYHRTTSDMLFAIPTPLTTGFPENTQNIGEMVNQGIDIDISGIIFKNRDWEVGAGTVFGYNKNKLTKIFLGLDEFPLPDYLLTYKVGTAYGLFYIEEFLGVDPMDGLPIYNDGKGNKTKDIAKVKPVLTNKNMFAPINGGFHINARWKGVSVYAQFSYTVGKWMIDNDGFFMNNTTTISGFSRTTDMRDIWRKPGDITHVPKYGANTIGFDSSILYNADYMRLKNLTVSYDFPKKLMDKTGFMAGARVYFVGRNLLTFTKFPGYDPEYYNNIISGQSPMTKEYTFGVELTF